MNIFIAKNGTRQGPYSSGQLKDLIDRGVVSMSDQVWYEGCAAWTPIREVKPLIDTIIPPLPSRAQGHAGADPTNDEPLEVQSQIDNSRWYYLAGEQTCGPSDTAEMKRLISAGTIPNTTYVFMEGMADWTKACTLPYFQQLNDEKPHPSAPTGVAESTPPPLPSIQGASEPRIQMPASSVTGATDSGKLFVWWPTSIVGSVILGSYLAYVLSVIVGKSSMGVITTINVGFMEALRDFGVASLALVMLAGGYLVAIWSRYLAVVAPHKRVLRKTGQSAAILRSGWYDHVMDHPSAFMVTGFALALLFGWKTWEASIKIRGERETIVSSQHRVEARQYDIEKMANDPMANMAANYTDEQLRADYDRALSHGLSPEYAAKEYNEMQKLRSSIVTKSAASLSDAVSALQDAKTAAMRIKALKVTRLADCGLAILAFGSCFALWRRSKLEHGQLQPATGESSQAT